MFDRFGKARQGLLAAAALVAALLGSPAGYNGSQWSFIYQACAVQSHVSGPEVHVPVKILAINDFHGQLGPGKSVRGRPAGSAPVLAAYLKAARRGWEDNSLIIHVGDLVGASPPNSAILQDEPSIMFFNLLANRPRRGKMDPDCDLAGTVGNHEFDEGVAELERLLGGGNYPEGPFLENPYKGARFPVVAANVVWAQDNRPLLPPYVIKKIKGMPIAFIGAVLKGTAGIVNPGGVAALKFLNEVDAINSYVPDLQAQKVRAIVVLLHQGGFQDHYAGPTRPDGEVSGPIVDIVNRLDDEIDVVFSGHTHRFTNSVQKNRHGKEILVTQAYAYGTAYADVTVQIDMETDDIVSKTATIVTTYADAGPGLRPDPAVAKLVSRADAKVGPKVHQVIGTAAARICKMQNSAGESALGDLIADAQRAALKTEFAFLNPGGIRADIAPGEVTWGELFTVQPFKNYLVKMELTGQQLYDLLEQQFPPHQGHARILQVSGLSYTWSGSRTGNGRIVEILKDGKPIDRAATYTVAVNSFLAEGSDKFSVFTQGKNRVTGPLDLEALVAYVQKLEQPFTAQIEGRIRRGD